jgi:hypothetical protein
MRDLHAIGNRLHHPNGALYTVLKVLMRTAASASPDDEDTGYSSFSGSDAVAAHQGTTIVAHRRSNDDCGL